MDSDHIAMTETLSYAGFVEALGRIALIALDKPAFERLYPSAVDKVRLGLPPRHAYPTPRPAPPTASWPLQTRLKKLVCVCARAGVGAAGNVGLRGPQEAGRDRG